MEKMKEKNKRLNGCFFSISWFVFIALISVLLSRFIMTGVNDMLAVGKNSEVIQIELPENASIDIVADVLSSKNIISEKWFFKLYSIATKSPKFFYSGFYELKTDMDYQSILNHLKNQDNVKDVVEITITEGMNALECATLIEKNGICSKDDFLKCCNSEIFKEKYSFLDQISTSQKRLYKLEGYLFPDTYKFYRDEKEENVINKLLNNYQKKIYQKINLEGNSIYKSIKELSQDQNMTVDKVLNIASLIQAEAANKEDMYKISSVIHNRMATLNSGGKNRFGEFSMHMLRIDATVYYPYRNKSSIPKEVSKNFSNGYNTYQIEGLPPGPICNPGLDAIQAALFPAQTDFYYYCHSSSGEAFYARTNQVHLSNLKKAGLV